MNDLQHFFDSHDGRLIHKWMHYFEIYDRHFSRFRGTDVHIVEIGIYHGGSLQMWRDYFGSSAKIIGIDIDPQCQDLAEEGIEIIIGNQEDRNFLRSLKEKIPRIDILLDDGGHTMTQQITTFEELFPHVSKNGVYLCEDLHTSYWSEYGGGFRKPSSFIEYSKELIDFLNAWHSRDPESFPVNEFTRSAYSMNFYGSVLVIEKQEVSPPRDHMTGHPSFELDKMTQIVERIEAGEPLQYELHHNPQDWQSRYTELNSRFFNLLDEHRGLQNYAQNAQRIVEHTQREHQQSQQQLQQLQQEYQQAQQHLQEHSQQLHQTQQHLQNTQKELIKTQNTLQTAKAEAASQIHQLQQQLEAAQLQLLQVQNDLIEAQQDREVQKFRVERLQTKIQQVRERLQKSRENLRRVEHDLAASQNEVAAIKTSKFWKLRTKWFKVKGLIGFKGD